MTKLLLNDQLKGVELYFEGKPSQTIIDSLKSNGFRYHGGKVCWYAKQSEKTMAEAQKHTLEQGTEQTQVKPLTLVTPVVKAQKEVKNNIILPLWDLTQWSDIQVDNKQGTKSIASEMRKHVRTRFPMCKFSITSDYSSVSFYIVASPYDQESEYLKAIRLYCDNLIKAYRYCTCDDPYGDYGSSYNFYGSHTSIDYHYKQTEQTAEIKSDMLDFDAKKALEETKVEEQKEKDYQLYLVQKELDKKSYEESAKKEAEQVQTINASISITDLAREQQYFVIGSQFAHLNKNNTLDQYKEDVEKGEFYLQNVKITKEIHFQTEEALSYFSNMLLNDFDFLAETGGSYTDDVRINSMTDYNNMTEEERKTVVFNLYGVGIYYNNELKFVVDAQGHSYARYVGLIENVTIQKSDNVDQLVNHKQIKELKGKVETLEDLSVEAITCNPSLVGTWDKENWNEYKDRMKQIFNKNYFKLTKSIIQQIPEESETLKGCMYRLLKEVDGIQEQFRNADLKQGQKVTLFYITDFGSVANQMVTLDSVEYTKYAQYDNAVKLTWIPKGKRKQYYNFFYSTLLVYEGWLELPQSVLHEVSESNDFVITKTKYLSCDKKQYDEILDHYEVQGLKPVINTYKPTF